MRRSRKSRITPTKVPLHYPDEEWDLWGVEMIPTRNDVYPLKTYPFFEDKVSMEFKDPLSAMLESLSRIGPGEQAWYQIVMTPIAQTKWQAKGEAIVKKLLGRETVARKGCWIMWSMRRLSPQGTLQKAFLAGRPTQKQKRKNRLNTGRSCGCRREKKMS